MSNNNVNVVVGIKGIGGLLLVAHFVIIVMLIR